MPIHCPFTPLAASPLVLRDKDLDRDLEEWLVAWNTHADDSLFYDTNIEALVFALNRAHGEDTAKLVFGTCYERIALVRPDQPEALALAAYYAARMLNGDHLDRAMYQEVLADACTDRWIETEISNRIEMMQMFGGSVGEALSDTVPECVRECLEECFEPS
jgi:hypothetical protein